MPKSKSVLIIADMVHNENHLAEFIDSIGHRSHIVQTLQCLENLLITHIPDVALLDTSLPPENWRHFLHRLMNHEEGCRIPLALYDGKHVFNSTAEMQLKHENSFAHLAINLKTALEAVFYAHTI